MNPLLTPELGTYVWSLVIFMTVLFVLRKYAWNPLLDFLEEREKDIAESLKMAESAKTDLEQIKDESEKILNEAKKEGKAIVGDSKLRAEAPDDGKPAIMYDVNCSGAKDYMDLALEIINEKK